jgi:hypothetical protein
LSSLGSPSLAIERRAGVERGLIALTLIVLASAPWSIAAFPKSLSAMLSVVGVIAAAIGFWRIGWLGGSRAVRIAMWSSEGEWRLLDQRGQSLAATLSGGSLVSGPVVWLRFDSEAGKRHVLLIGPGSDREVFRRLSARLRLAWAQVPQRSANP